MTKDTRIAQAIYAAVEELNQQLPEERQLDKSNKTELFGQSGKLDSLGLVNLVITIEENVSDEFGVPITVADERAMSQKNSPFKTIGTLGEYIAMLLGEAGID